MKAGYVLGLFAATVLYQVGIPAAMIARRERVLREGDVIRIRTAPVDPYDAFRGRYVRLGMNNWTLPLADEDGKARTGRWIYMTFTNDVEGFSAPAAVRVQPPAAGPYLCIRARVAPGGVVYARPPFDRYYLEEHRAPAAETAYRDATARTNRDAHVVVRVLGGQGVLEDLVIAGKSAREIGR